MRALAVTIFVAAILLTLVALAFLGTIIRGPSNWLEIAVGIVALVVSLVAVAGTWSVYQRTANRPG